MGVTFQVMIKSNDLLEFRQYMPDLMTKASLFFWTVSEMVIMFLLAFLVIFVYESNHVCVKISWVSLHFSYSIHLDLCHTIKSTEIRFYL